MLLVKPCIHALHNNQQRREKGCYQYSDSIKFNNNGQLQFNNVASFEEGASTIEAMVNLSSHANQVLFCKLSEEVFGELQANYRYRGMMAVVDGGKLHINLYGRDSTEQKLAAYIYPNNFASTYISTWSNFDTSNQNCIYTYNGPFFNYGRRFYCVSQSSSRCRCEWSISPMYVTFSSMMTTRRLQALKFQGNSGK